MSRYWSSIVHRLTPYVAGEQPAIADLVKLNTNENPYGPSPHVIAAIKAHIGDTLRLYPDPSALRLRATIANCYGIDADQVFVGNGSDEVLAHTFQALLQHDDPLLFPDITYSFYQRIANCMGSSFAKCLLAKRCRSTLPITFDLAEQSFLQTQMPRQGEH